MTSLDHSIAGLLAAIIAEPQRDDLRMIYADAIDDAGQHERAEFVRVQVELAALPPWHHIELRRGDEFRVAPYADEITGAFDHSQRQYRRRMEGYASTFTWPVGMKDGDSFSMSFKDEPGNCSYTSALRLLDHNTSSVDGFSTFTFDDQGQPDPHREKRQKLKKRESELLKNAENWLADMLRAR